MCSGFINVVYECYLIFQLLRVSGTQCTKWYCINWVGEAR